jgi:hypothetical protein
VECAGRDNDHGAGELPLASGSRHPPLRGYLPRGDKKFYIHEVFFPHSRARAAIEHNVCSREIAMREEPLWQESPRGD